MENKYSAIRPGETVSVGSVLPGDTFPEATPPWELANTVGLTDETRPPWELASDIGVDTGAEVADTWQEALVAGFDKSSLGLILSGGDADYILNDKDKGTLYNLAASAGETGSDVPLMFVGGALGFLATVRTGKPRIIAAATGAGAEALPETVKQAYAWGLGRGEYETADGFLNKLGIFAENVAGKASYGALGSVAGEEGFKVASKLGAGKLVAGATGSVADAFSQLAASAVINQRLPSKEEFIATAVTALGLEAVRPVASKVAKSIRNLTPDEVKETVQKVSARLLNTFSMAGKHPREVLADANKDPALLGELLEGTPAARLGDQPTTAETPAIMKPLGIEDTGVPSAYNREVNLAAANRIVQRYVDNGASIPQISEDEILNSKGSALNLAPLRTEDEVKAVVQDIVNTLENTKGSPFSQGSVPQEKTYIEAARVLSTLIGDKDNLDSIVLPSDRAGAFTANLVARKLYLEESSRAFYSALSTLQGGTVEMNPSVRKQFHNLAHNMVVAANEAKVFMSQAGRSLRAIRYTKVNDELIDTLNRNSEKISSMSEEDFAEYISRLQSIPSAKGRINYLSQDVTPTFGEKAVYIWKSSLIGTVTGLTTNAISAAVNVAKRPIIDAIAVGLNRGFGVGNNKVRMSYAEPYVRAMSNLRALVDIPIVSLQAAVRKRLPESVFGSIPEYTTPVTRNALETEVYNIKNPISGTLGKVVETPFTISRLTDSYFRDVNAYGEAMVMAHRQAIEENVFPVGSKKFDERVVELATSDKKILDAASEYGARMTFNAEAGAVTKSVMQAIKHAGPVAQVVFPFMQTPTNIAKETLRLTPAASWLVPEWRADMRAGGAERSRALAEQVFGLSVAASIILLAEGNEDLFSGAGPMNSAERRVKIASGWQQESFKLSPDGEWIANQRLGPLGNFFSMAATIAEVKDNMYPEEWEESVSALAIAATRMFNRFPIVAGAATITSSGDEYNRQKFIERFISSVVPGIVAEYSKDVDTVQREVYGITDAVKARLPGFRENLTEKIDVWGTPIPVSGPAQTDDKVRLEAVRLGVGSANTPDYITLPGKAPAEMRRVELTPEQKHRYAINKGQYAYRRMRQVVESPGWENRSAQAKQEAFKKAFSDASEYAAERTLSPEQRRKESRRINDALRKTLQEK